ncbi:MAG: hypothetical protein HYZ37_17180 [Candidatus Solibacter usitatus]|nr:hypothetical protein [Candidatus Solibacter usitatus]
MNCPGVNATEIIERYLSLEMTESECEEWERHYFTCHSCFPALDAAVSIRRALQARAVKPKVIAMRRRWVWAVPAIAAVAAGLVIGIILPARRASQSESRPLAAQSMPSPDLITVLARVDAPRYTPLQLRAAEDEYGIRFRAAMAHYTRKDYRSAADALAPLATERPEHLPSRFFLGASRMLSGNASGAAADFQAVIAAGDSSYLEEAWFYLAKVRIAMKDIAGARVALQAAAALKAGLAAESGELLERLKALQ